MKTTLADPCPTLSNPRNGALICTGPQVTDQSCSYTCQNGYNLTGSVTRKCQPDHTWSGDPTSCPPLQCIELLGQNNAFVVDVTSTPHATFSVKMAFTSMDQRAGDKYAN